MGTDTPAAGGETKIKQEDNRVHGGRNNIRRNNNNYTKKEKFLGAHPSLQGHVFEAKHRKSDQVSNYKTVDDIIKAQIGADSDPYVLESLEKESLTLPPEPSPVYNKDDKGKDTNTVSEIEMIKFKSKYGKYLSRIDNIENQAKQTFSVYYGQISEDMRTTLMENSNYERAFQEKDVFTLRKMLKAVNYNYRKTEEPFKTLVVATKEMMQLRQNDMTLQEYYTKFESLKKVVDEIYQSDYGSPFVDIICHETKKDPKQLTTNQRKELIKEGEERMQAMQIILNADRNRYKTLWEDYDRAYLTTINGLHVNKYPKTCIEAYTLLKNWNKNPDQLRPGHVKPGMAFNTIGDEGGEKTKCTRCGRNNHTVDQCFAKNHADGSVLHTMGSLDEEYDPEVSTKHDSSHSENGTDYFIDFYCGNEIEQLMFLQPDVNFNSPTERSSIRSKTEISESWILLDSQSTIDVFSNPNLLTKIHMINTTLRIRCNAGIKTTNYILISFGREKWKTSTTLKRITKSLVAL